MDGTARCGATWRQSDGSAPRVFAGSGARVRSRAPAGVTRAGSAMCGGGCGFLSRSGHGVLASARAGEKVEEGGVLRVGERRQVGRRGKLPVGTGCQRLRERGECNTLI